MVSPMIENDFIYACIFNNEKSIDLTAYLEYFNLSETPWVFCCFEFPNINSDNQYATYMKLHELLNKEHRCLISSFMMNRIVLFFPVFSENPDYNEVQEQIKKFYNLMKKVPLLAGILGVGFSIVFIKLSMVSLSRMIIPRFLVY